VRAAFHALVSEPKVDAGSAAALHEFALTERTSED
jgi:hypothetical protein